MITIKKQRYTLTLDRHTGRVLSLRDAADPRGNWISEERTAVFGLPFINGTQTGENVVPCILLSCTDSGAELRSREGAISLSYVFREDQIDCRLHTVTDCGPRAGLRLDLNLLDMAWSGPWQQQCMPHVLYTDEDYDYAYLIFATAEGRYLAMTLEGFGAWRILYSYAGHRMTGFQVLTQADDVRVGHKKPLPVSDELRMHIFLEDSEEACLRRVAGCLEIGIVIPEISGGVRGGVIPFSVAGSPRKCLLVEPRGDSVPLGEGSLELQQEGLYALVTEGPGRRRHVSRVLCQESWRAVFDRVNDFYMEHFQDPSGAFYRAVWADTCSPGKGFTMEGTAFGDIHALYSCRTGEFGGFAPWAMIKNCLLFGREPRKLEAIRRYICDWALNRGHEDKPYNSTVCRFPAQYLGRSFGPFHLYRELNYPQHEAFLMEQLADYFRLTGDSSALRDGLSLAKHFIKEHMDASGMVICENLPGGRRVDYSTVHVPICGLIRLAELAESAAPEDAALLWERAEALADHVCRRGLHFPTEGEACTEDGSMTCTVITLLWAYRRLQPKPEYLALAKKLLQLHRVLELGGEDCRQRNSSLRFWETQYETRDWGPSINAGHGWSIWQAEAKALMAMTLGSERLLREAYEGFITNLCKVRPNGAMPCCFTPDMIPGTPHKPCVWGGTEIVPEVTELRPTTTVLAMDYVSRTYSCSGNYFLVKAGEIWSHVSGLDLGSRVCTNGSFRDGAFLSAAPEFDCLVLSGVLREPLAVLAAPGRTIEILGGEGFSLSHADGGTLTALEPGRYTVAAEASVIRIR